MSEVTVVTINYNNAIGLRRTIASVLAQSCAPEYVVIDGGSSDESRQVIEEHASRTSHWVSERDRGVYEAMNKGIRAATSEYVLFLNSGDTFDSRDAVATLLRESAGHDIVYGDLVVQDGAERRIKSYPDVLTFDYFRKDSLPHPCSLIRRSLFASVHPYDESLKIAADWALFMNAICLHRASYRHVAEPIAVFTTDGLSSEQANQRLIKQEREQVLRTYYAAFLPDYQAHDARARRRRPWWRRVGRKAEIAVRAARQRVLPTWRSSS
jgi:glycosyltransferase involved in cell wall biosynthesis